MAAALSRLVAPAGPEAAGAAGGGADPTRLNRRAFRERLCQVVADVRGMLRVR
jgi:hypothetical protein